MGSLLFYYKFKEKKMFRKGIVTFFDDALGKGFIEINTDQQSVGFLLEDFSNASLLPQVGERVKCVVLEQDGELLAKFIVRLDHKNHNGDAKKQLVVNAINDDHSFENIQTVRKMLKKRRIILENENTAIDSKLNEIKPVEHIDAIQPDEHIQLEDTLTQREVILDDLVEVEFSQVSAEVENTQISTEENNKSVDNQIVEIDENEGLERTSLKDYTPENIDLSEVPNEPTATKIAEIQPIKVQTQPNENTYDHVGNGQLENDQVVSAACASTVAAEMVLSEQTDIQQNHQYLSNQVDQQLLEKNMNFNFFQRFIQKIKVKFLYSKRKQGTKVKTDSTRFHLNPLIVVMGAFVLLCLGSVKYAYERYQQYKVETELKLQQYEKQQQDVIKKQKQEAHAR